MCNQGLWNIFCFSTIAIVLPSNKFREALNKEQYVQIIFCKDGFELKAWSFLGTQLRF